MTCPKEARQWWAEWNKSHPKHRVSLHEVEETRRKAQTDHAFLAKLLGYNKFQPEVHDEMWKFFVQKNPDIQPFETFALADTSTHDRLLLLPRNGFKSTGKCVDCVQFIICWPDITYLKVAGKEAIGQDFIDEIRGHFERQDDGTPRLVRGKYSEFQLAFPEFCTDGKSKAKAWTTPARRAVSIKEETIQFCGVETSQSGPHYDIIDFDDPVTNENSKTPTRLIAIRNQISYHRKMMNPYGYCDLTGTWYSTHDHYGFVIRAEEENRTLFWSKRKADSRDVEGRDRMTKIMIRPAMWERDDKELDIDGDIHESDWELWFPERLTWKWLMKERGTNRDLFHSQLMNNPNLTKSVRFQRPILERQTRIFTEMPQVHSGYGLIVQGWDTAYSDTSLANYTVGLTALILGGRFYFLDMVRGQFSDYDVSRVMADSMGKWRPNRIVMEESMGVRWLATEVKRHLESMNFSAYIEFLKVDNKKNRKFTMASPVATRFSEGTIILSNAIPNLGAMYDELEGFQNGAPNDDIVDAMSLIVNYFQYVPEASVMALKADFEEESARRKGREAYNRVFGIGTGDFAPVAQQTGEVVPSWVQWSPMDVMR